MTKKIRVGYLTTIFFLLVVFVFSEKISIAFAAGAGFEKKGIGQWDELLACKRLYEVKKWCQKWQVPYELVSVASTAYSPDECKKYYREVEGKILAECYTATGNVLEPNWSIAVDPGCIDLGSILFVEGYGWGKAQDTGGAIIGNKIDVSFQTGAQCKANWGYKTGIYVLKISPGVMHPELIDKIKTKKTKK